MNWVEITVIAPAEQVEAVGDLLRKYSPTGTIAEEQWGDPTDLAPRAMLPDVHCKIYLQEDQFSPQLREQIRQQLSAAFPALAPPSFALLAETDWTTAWQKNYRTFRLGERFVIQPSWLVGEGWPDPKPTDIPIIIEPGMAFGTGLHETTQLCLTALESLVKPKMSLLDVGTGSGILSFAAAKLGAKPIMAVDNDPVAIRVAEANAALNGLPTEINWATGSLAEIPSKSWDLVVVNILAIIIERMIREDDLLTYANLAGTYLFSGIIDSQRDMMQDAVQSAGGRVIREWQDGDWLAMQVVVD